MHKRAWELLEAMGNCYRACSEDYTKSLQMISGWRGFSPKEVEQILLEIRAEASLDQKYIKLRKNFPADWIPN